MSRALQYIYKSYAYSRLLFSGLRVEIQKTLGTSDSPVHFSFSMQLAGMRNQPQYYFFPREGRRRKGFGGHCDKDKEQLGQLCACLRYYCI